MMITFVCCLLTFLAEPVETLTHAELIELTQVMRLQDTKRLDAILQARPKLLNQGIWDEGTITLLRMCADERLPKIAEHLLIRGVRVDIRSAAMLGWDDEIRALAKKKPKGILPEHEWESPVYDAITHERLSTVKLLLDLGDPLLKEDWNEEAHDPLSNAFSPRGEELVRLLLSRMDEKTWRRLAPGAMKSLCSDTTNKLEPILKLMLAHKPSVGEPDWKGGAYLRAACQAGNISAVRLLLQAGADPDGRASPANPARFQVRFQAFVESAFTLNHVLNPTSPEMPGVRLPRKDEDVRASAKWFVVRTMELMPLFFGASVLTNEETGLLPPLHVAGVSVEIKEERTRSEIAELLSKAGAKWTFAAAVAFGKTKLGAEMLATDPELRHEIMYLQFMRGRVAYDRRRPQTLDGLIPCYPIRFAAARGYTDIVRLLLPFDQPKVLGDQPLVIQALQAAAERGHLETVQAILSSTVHAKTVKEKLGSVFPHAGRSGKVAVLEALAADRTPTKEEASNALREAARMGHLAMVKRASTLGGNPDEADQFGFTALIHAAENGSLEIVQWLLEQRVDPNRTSREGDGAIHLAAQNGHLSCIKALVGAKADLELTGKNGYTPLLRAASSNRPAVIATLIVAGADIQKTGPGSESALHIAADVGSVDAVKELVKLGADVNAKKRGGDTPLEIVVKSLKSPEYTKYEQWAKIKEILESPPQKK